MNNITMCVASIKVYRLNRREIKRFTFYTF